MMHYITKEFLQNFRSKGLWVMLFIVFLTAIFILSAAKAYPSDLGFETFLLNLFDMCLMIVPLFTMLISAISVFNEKESKSMNILLTKKESKLSFLLKKTIAVQTVIVSCFTVLLLVVFALAKLIIAVDMKAMFIFLLSLIVLIIISNQIGILIGYAVSTRIAFVSAAIIVWFIFVFVLDLIYLYFIPAVTYDNVKLFGVLYFLDPMHSIRIFLEYMIGLFSLNNMSAMMSDLVKWNPVIYMILTTILWPVALFFITLMIPNRGEVND